MHVCEDFRERITEHIIDRRSLEDVDLQREVLVCNSCFDFYTESKDLIDAMSGVQFEIADETWTRLADQTRARILEAQGEERHQSWRSWLKLTDRRIRVYVPAVAGAAVMLFIAVGVSRLVTPLLQQKPAAASSVASPSMSADGNTFNGVSADVLIDPVTVDYLAQSELLLRSVMKLKASSTEDLQEARRIADRQLVGLDQRKEAVAQVQPIVHVMDKYEMILREIRNIRGPGAAEDISDIKNRIQKNGLIADIHAFQPKAVSVDTGFDDNR